MVDRPETEREKWFREGWEAAEAVQWDREVRARLEAEREARRQGQEPWETRQAECRRGRFATTVLCCQDPISFPVPGDDEEIDAAGFCRRCHTVYKVHLLWVEEMTDDGPALFPGVSMQAQGQARPFGWRKAVKNRPLPEVLAEREAENV